MRLLYSWLKEFLPELDKSAEEVAELLTLHSFETVVAKKITVHPSIIIVKVEQIDPHPNADRLKLATVTDGQKQIQVVCGATNYQVGDIVPYSPPGADVFDEGGEQFTVKEAIIRGQVSPGMLNSPRELGLGEWHVGLWVLPADTPLGTPLNQLLPDDTILEADITPNRAHDCLSHRGVARELAALIKLTIIPSPQVGLPAELVGRGKGEGISGEWKISIADPTLAPRYMAAVIDNLTVKPSPLTMQFRLLAAGTHPINNLVDITNYVMFELGQPVHLFDRTALPGKTVGVRLAQSDEKIIDFDNIEHTLSPENVVITADDKVIALAGITGALNTGITAKTTRGLLEIANFHPYAIQKSARAVNIRTEASARFIKGLDPSLAAEAQARCLALLQELAGSMVIQVLDNYPTPFTPPIISFRPNRPAQLAGTEITSRAAKEALERLRCVIVEQADTWHVTPPSDRLDLTGEHDLVEEVIRLYGLKNIPSRGPARRSLSGGGGEIREKLRDQLVKIGFIEVYNYSFETELIAQAFNLIDGNSLKLSNPVAPEQAHLRQSLVPRLIENVVTNKAEWRKRTSDYSRALFEISPVFKKGAGGVVPGVLEEDRLAGITLDVPLEAIITALNTVFGDKITTQPINGTAQWEKGTEEILLNNKSIGYIGILSSAALLSLHAKIRLKPGLQAFEIRLNSAKI